jgi:transcriptional regulator with XRE-family HTH domain
MRKPTPLKLAIVASGSTQQDIAAAVGMHPSQFSRVVNGLWCDDETRAAIAAVLGRTVEELFGGHESASNVPTSADASREAA